MKKPIFVEQNIRETLSWKEQDFLVMLYMKKFTKKQLMRRLYITTDVGYWKLKKRVREKITINKVNK